MDSAILMSIIGLGTLGLFFGLFLAYASKKFHVEVDPKIEQIQEILPGANCGGCGYPGCNGYAEAVVKGVAEIDLCAPGGSQVIDDIAKILGLENSGTKVPEIAAVQCKGGKKEAKSRFQYLGIMDCTAAQLIGGGNKACTYGCLGLGNCVRVCLFDAIKMNENGLPVVDDAKCTGCGACVKACPRDIITLIPVTQQIYLGCVSHDKAKKVKAVCSVGCTGCSLCSRPKVTPSGAIEMDNNLPIIKDITADDLINAVNKCPAKSFVVRKIAEDLVQKPQDQIEVKNSQ